MHQEKPEVAPELGNRVSPIHFDRQRALPVEAVQNEMALRGTSQELRQVSK